MADIESTVLSVGVRTISWLFEKFGGIHEKSTFMWRLRAWMHGMTTGAELSITVPTTNRDLQRLLVEAMTTPGNVYVAFHDAASLNQMT